MLPLRKHDKDLSRQPSWVQDAMHGFRLMREGTDYENNGKRYDRAHVLLNRAYTEALTVNPAIDPVDLARICLWNGITLNENLDINPFTKRNEEAIKWYRRGLRLLRMRDVVLDANACVVKASLYNSMGVAHHHRTTRWLPDGGPIPQAAFYNYHKAMDIIQNKNNKKSKNKREFEIIAKKIEQNTGGRVSFRGGGIENIGGGNYF